MGYSFTIAKSYRVKADKEYPWQGYRVKADKEYPWPCALEPKRTLTIFTDDVLTLRDDGTFMKHTGLGTFGHVIPLSDVIEHDSETHLRML